MIGLDKKSLRKLEKLEGLADGVVSERDRQILINLGEWYRNPEFRFYTSAQRRMLDDLETRYLTPPTRKELLFLEAAEASTEDEYSSDMDKEIGLSIFGRNGKNIKAFSDKEIKFFTKLLKNLAERRRQKEVRDLLEKAVEAGEVRFGSERFCESIIRQFDERKSWSPIQMEHAEKILAGNTDPDDDED